MSITFIKDDQNRDVPLFDGTYVSFGVVNWIEQGTCPIHGNQSHIHGEYIGASGDIGVCLQCCKEIREVL